MPGARAAKRTLEEVVNAEESGDEDYNDRAPGPSKSRIRRSGLSGRPARKKRRRDYGSGSDDVSDDGDELGQSSVSESDHDDEPPEINENGRPVRRAAKGKTTYEESDPEVDDFGDRSESSDEVKPAATTRPQRLIVKLKTGATPAASPAPPTRNLRTRSGSFAGRQQHPIPAEPSLRSTRRSSRIAHDEEETVVALTNSGHHVEVVRAGSKGPEGIPARAMKGGKGLKYPSNSTIEEQSGESGAKDEPTDELEIKASQHEILESDPQTQGDAEDSIPRIVTDLQAAAEEAEDNPEVEDVEGVVPESAGEEEGDDDDDDDDDDPIARGRSRRLARRKAESLPLVPKSNRRRRTRHTLSDSASGKRPARSGRRKSPGESSDFAPDIEQEKEDEMSDSEESGSSPRKSQRHEDYDSSNGPRSRLRRPKVASRHSPASEEDIPDLAEELADLQPDRSRKRRPRNEIVYEDKPRRTRGNVDYRILRPELNIPIEDQDEDAPTPSRRARGGGGTAGGWQRTLFSTYGPFGGAGGLAPVLGGPAGTAAAGGVDSDSSDDETMQRPRAVGGAVGMTPTSAFAPVGYGPFPPSQTLHSDPAQGPVGTPANLGKVKDKQALADADPLGVDQNVNFDSVGGLQGHIDQLKEMVSLPLLYPEIFMRFHIVPPRGVLFHGPPGTGKTLLARALASTVSSQGRKVTFYMRKGADALSKWVGEAERQLRLLFEEARKNQPSIIFFDEIDGLAPVRSSKQEQIHASIVSTLLALMDGMDGRGQVVVIGATNRPDSIDPALRRPGRFDREFYFPLPNTEARRKILDIHTKGWDPPLESAIKDELAGLTKGYGGADLRALCTEAALNAVQRRYPQIYKSNEKLLIDPTSIKVSPKDFMISVKKMIPSSERSAASGAASLPSSVEPLLRQPFLEIKSLIAQALPLKKTSTALEEAQYEDLADGQGFRIEKMQEAFETSRVFRPRLIIEGDLGMGQQYLAAALLNHFEGLHVQSFDLPTLLSDSSTSHEATVVRLFSEVKMHRPSVIYLPNIHSWYSTVGSTVTSAFTGLLRSLKPTDPVLLLGVVEADRDDVDSDMLKRLFGYSKKNEFKLEAPTKPARHEFFSRVFEYVKTTPNDFPNPINRKKRPLEILKPAPPEAPKHYTRPSKEQIKAQKKQDRQTLNLLKIRLQPIMDQIRTKYRKFRTGVIEENQIRYLYDEADPGTVSSDLHTELLARASFRPYEVDKDGNGEPGLKETATGKFYYNLDTVTIEKRLSNGYYKRPKDFLADVKRLAKDAKTLGDEERLLKANELLTNVEVDVGGIELGDVALTAECEKVYQRELLREKEAVEKAKKTAEENGEMAPPRVLSNVPHGGASQPSTVNVSTGPIVLGEALPNGRPLWPPVAPATPSRSSTSVALTNGYGSLPHVGSDLNLANEASSHNGGHDADVEGDTHMDGTDSHPNSHENSYERHETQKTDTTTSSSFGQSAQPRPLHSYTAPSQQMRRESGMSAPLSQQGAFTPMAPGSQVADYENDASTTQTTSGKGHSGPSSGDKERPRDVGPNLYLYDAKRPAGSACATEIPDTQDFPPSQGSGGSQPSDPHSRPSSQSVPHPPVPAFDGGPTTYRQATGSIQALLNDDEGAHHPPLMIDHTYIENLHEDITSRTSGLSVEQLEQINSALMDLVWKTKAEWNRTGVALQVGGEFNEVFTDMKSAGQYFGQSSWGRDDD